MNHDSIICNASLTHPPLLCLRESCSFYAILNIPVIVFLFVQNRHLVYRKHLAAAVCLWNLSMAIRRHTVITCANLSTQNCINHWSGKSMVSHTLRVFSAVFIYLPFKSFFSWWGVPTCDVMVNVLDCNLKFELHLCYYYLHFQTHPPWGKV